MSASRRFSTARLYSSCLLRSSWRLILCARAIRASRPRGSTRCPETSFKISEKAASSERFVATPLCVERTPRRAHSPTYTRLCCCCRSHMLLGGHGYPAALLLAAAPVNPDGIFACAPDQISNPRVNTDPPIALSFRPASRLHLT